MDKTVKKIDVHVHTAGWNGAEMPRFGGDTYATPEQIREKYKAWGIEKGVILPELNPDGAFYVQSNEEAHKIAAEHPDLFYWFCNLNPAMGNNSPSTDFSYFINHYKAMGARGVGELTANLYADEPLVDNLFRHCADCDMPVTIHIAPKKYDCYGIIDELGLPRIEKMLKKYPKLKIFGHSQPFWAEISSDASEANRNSYPHGKVEEGRLVWLMREYENLYGDMSAGSGENAFTRDPEFGCRFIEEFQDKLLFGTDICAPSNYMGLSRWLDEAVNGGRISEKAYRKVSRENAIRLLRLDEA